MFTTVINEHKKASKQTRLQLENDKIKSVECLRTAINSSIGNVNDHVSELYKNQEQIENETRLLQKQSEIFSQEALRWNHVYKKLNESILELGHVDDWVRTIDKDLKFVADVMDNVMARNDKE